MKTISALELRQAVPLGFGGIFSDDSFAIPTKRWLLEDFWVWFYERRLELGLMKWTRNNDCDNFARAYAQYAADCHALTSNQTEGLAVGEFYYRPASGGGHAIVIALTDEGVIFIEPQTGKQLQLTQEEISSCFFVRF
jgi:hypothetical protein